MQVNRRPSARYRLDTTMARDTSSMESSGEHIYRQSKYQNMVAHLLFELLAVSAGYCHTATRALGSNGFDEFYGGAYVEHIELVAHIFIGSQNFNLTAGTRVWGHGLMLL